MKLIPLADAAEKLGVSVEKLLEMRQNNEIFGYRDGSTWKFKDTELDRVAGSLGISLNEGVTSALDGDSGVDLELASESGSDANILGVDSDLEEMISVEDSGLLEIKEDKPIVADDDVLELGAADDDDEIVLEDSGIELADSDIELQLEDSGIDLELTDDEPATGVAAAAAAGAAAIAGTAAAAAAGSADDSEIELSLEDSGVELGGSDIELSLDDSGPELTVEGDSDPVLELDEEPELNLGEESGVELNMEGSDTNPGLLMEDSGPLELAGGSDAELTLEGDDELILGDAEENAATLVGGSDVKEEAPAASSEGGSDFDFDLSDVDLADDGSASGKGIAGAAAAGVAAAGAAAAAAATGALKADSGILDLDGSDISLEASSDLDLNLEDSSVELDLDNEASSSSIKLDESGINLSSPSDSGLSLEGTPELGAGSDVDALELGEAEDDLVEEIVDIGDESVDLEEATVMGDNDFLLEPVEADVEDMDSGSQIIALDTEEIETDDTLLGDAFVETTDEHDADLGGMPETEIGTVPQLGAAATAAPEIPYTVWNIVGLALCTLLMTIGGMMMSDLVMNMWSWDGTFALNSQLMDAVLGMFGG